MSISEKFAYLNRNNLTNVFTSSLEASFLEFNNLTEKQEFHLDRLVENHQLCAAFFEDYTGTSKFVSSLKEQFYQKGWLTDKQMTCLLGKA
jgi:hypothetical protein